MRWRGRRPDDFDEEIEAHLAIETEQLMAEGMPRDQAARAARRAFGNATTARERSFQSSAPTTSTMMTGTTNARCVIARSHEAVPLPQQR